MKAILVATIICLAVLLDDCNGGGGDNSNRPIPPSDTPDCEHFYTCDTANDFGCNPDASLNLCPNNGKCVDRGCVPQPGTITPPSGGGIKITFNSAGPQGGALGIQKYDHSTRMPVGNRQYIKIRPSRPANKVANDFCALSNFLGIYCTASGNVASFHNAELDIYYYTNELSQGDNIPFP